MRIANAFSKSYFPRTLLAVAVSSAVLAACGGGSGGTASNNKLVSGTITGFGSIHVGGKHILDNPSTIVDKDGTLGAPGDTSKLNVGDNVKICTSTDSNGNLVADKILSKDELEGFVTIAATATLGACDAAAGGSLEVMGRTVNYTDTLVFESNVTGATVCDLVATTAGSPGTAVEIHGAPNASGGIDATKIQAKAVEDEIEVKGAVDAVTASVSGGVNDTVTMGHLKMTIAAGTSVQAGNFVEAKLNADLTPPVGSGDPWTVTASEISLDDNTVEGCSESDGAEAEIEGQITSAYDAQSDSFTIDGGQVVIVGSASIDTASLVAGTQVEVEGSYSNGDLSAGSIKIDQEATASVVKTSGTVASIIVKGSTTDLTASNYDFNATYTLTLDNSLSVDVKPGQVIFDDKDNLLPGNPTFDLVDLIGSSIMVTVKYTSNPDVAVKIELNSQV